MIVVVLVLLLVLGAYRIWFDFYRVKFYDHITNPAERLALLLKAENELNDQLDLFNMIRYHLQKMYKDTDPIDQHPFRVQLRECKNGIITVTSHLKTIALIKKQLEQQLK